MNRGSTKSVSVLSPELLLRAVVCFVDARIAFYTDIVAKRTNVSLDAFLCEEGYNKEPER